MKKNLLIIGGSHGIGHAIIKALSDNYHIISASRTAPEGQVAAQHLTFDVLTDKINTSGLPDKLNGFIYCPGSINLKPFKMMTPQTFEEDMELNFFGMVRILKEILPLMADNSSVLLFSTVAVKNGMPFHSSVAACKGAIEGFGRALAAEYAPKIRVNVIAPSLIDTPLSAKLLNNDKKKEQMADRHPMKRIGTATDIAKCAEFLLSDDSSWITGQIIGVDGGMSTLSMH